MRELYLVLRIFFTERELQGIFQVTQIDEYHDALDNRELGCIRTNSWREVIDRHAEDLYAQSQLNGDMSEDGGASESNASFLFHEGATTTQGLDYTRKGGNTMIETVQNNERKISADRTVKSKKSGKGGGAFGFLRKFSANVSN
jgi:hypothetical protein